ncbi:MAG: hypothetical protein O3A47_13875, partial [Chloroflexi bacterium]|nr:hypothetical protein [Chloroflexota bacterium]
MRGKFGERYYDQVGMTWVWGKIHTRFESRGKGLGREKLGYPIGSFGEVFDVLTDRVTQSGGTVETSTTVSRVAVDKGRVAGLTTRLTPATWTSPQPLTYLPDPLEAGDIAEERYQDFDSVIATSPSYILPKLVDGLPPEYLAKLTGTEYLAAVLVILVLDRP